MTSSWARALFWAAFILCSIVVLHQLSGILLPFAAGAGIAFVLSPSVDRLERSRIPRPVAASVVLVGFLVLIVLVLLLLVPILQQQLGQFISRFPDYIDDARNEFDKILNLLTHRLSRVDMQQLRAAAGAKIGDILSQAGQVLGTVLTGGAAVANALSLIFITPIVAFFLLRDWHKILDSIDSWVPIAHRQTMREQAKLVEETLSGFLRGQAAVCFIMGVFYAIGLSIIGLDVGLMLGLLIGVLIFIPFIGGITGAIVAIMLGFAQFGDWHQPAFIAGLFLVGQTLESNVVTPKLVGDRVHLHPVWIIFALLAAGDLLGILGVLIAVPVAAVIGVFARFAINRYLNSSFYAVIEHQDTMSPEP